MTTRTSHHLPRVALAVLAAVLLPLCGGCRLRADVAVDLQQDLSGTLTVRLAPDAELRSRLADAGLDLEAMLTDAVEGAEDWRVDSGEQGVAVASDFDGPDELARRSEELAQGLAAAELRPLEPFTVAVDGREVEVQGGAALAPTDTVAELGYTPSEATAALAEAVEYRVAVSAPGEVVATTAGAVAEDGRAVWTVPAGEEIDVGLTARRPLLTPLRLGLGLLATVAVAGVIWLVRRRRAA